MERNLQNSLGLLNTISITDVYMELVIQLYTYKITGTDTDHIKYGKEIRQYEIDDCFIRNINNPVFSKIHILLESEKDLIYYKGLIQNNPLHTKCIFVIFGKQPLYSDIVKYIDTSIPPGVITCIMNSDIFMGQTSLNDLNSIVKDHTFVSLTRHEYTDDLHSICNVDTCHLIYKYHGSHDAFIFKTPVPVNYDYASVSIPQNIGGSEAVFMKSWESVGKKLVNPCFTIPIYHRHKKHFYLFNYSTIATHELCNVRPTIPEGRDDIKSQMIQMF